MTPSDSATCAPCIVGAGIVANRTDIQRLLCDLGQVQYFDLIEGEVGARGTGYIMEVFADGTSATMAIGHTLYINVNSFDYLEVNTGTDGRVSYDLVQDSRVLRLVPVLVGGGEELEHLSLQDFQALEAAVADVLAASLEAQMDRCDVWQELGFGDRPRDFC